MNKHKRQSIIAVLLVITLISIPKSQDNYVTAKETNVYLTVEDFAQELGEEIGLDPTTGAEDSGYVNVLIDKEIIKEGDFTSYKKNITRGDVLVIMNRADEYLNGNTVNGKLVQTVLEKRISDIDKVNEVKKEDVAKGYIKGFMRGYTNGAYCTNRKLKPTSKMTMKGALDCIKMLKNNKLRAKVSPDGQLIRTTGLPKNAKMFPYILASYPNKYYEWQLLYQRSYIIEGATGEEKELKNLIDYASPANIDKLAIDDYDDFAAIKSERLDEWVNKAKKHLELVFSVDYRTIGDDWFNDMLKINFQYGTNYEKFPRRKLNEYIDRMKANKTIVEYKTVAVDGSSLYYYDGCFYMRVYAKYRIKSSEAKYTTDVDKYMKERPYDKILFSNGFVKMSEFHINEWKEGYYDIELIDNNSDGNIGVDSIWFDLGKGLK